MSNTEESVMLEHNILARLEHLEAVNSIRNCLNRYMEICDALNASTDLNELMALFSADAVWEGIGERYAKSFGRYEGAKAISAMFASYMRKESHFSLNAHFVNSEQIQVQHDHAVGKWLMLQTSSFVQGGSHLNAAKLHIDFKRIAVDQWVIAHFRTENIFSRQTSDWSDQAALPVPSLVQE